MQATSETFESADFEVFGKVQGVYFRKYTHETAQKLGIVGWVMNTNKKTVVGTIQGPADKMKEMKHWLAVVGSPKSKIQKCVFKNEKKLSKLDYGSFDINK